MPGDAIEIAQGAGVVFQQAHGYGKLCAPGDRAADLRIDDTGHIGLHLHHLPFLRSQYAVVGKALVAAFVIAHIVKQKGAAGIHFQVEVTNAMMRLEKKLDAGILADLTLKLGLNRADIAVVSLKNPVDIAVVMQNPETDLRNVVCALWTDMGQSAGLSILPDWIVPVGFEFWSGNGAVDVVSHNDSRVQQMTI